MTEINLSDAQEKFGDLVELLKSKQQKEIILTEDGKPTIKMSCVANIITDNKKRLKPKRIGVAKGKFKVPDDFDKWDKDVAAMFGGV